MEQAGRQTCDLGSEAVGAAGRNGLDGSCETAAFKRKGGSLDLAAWSSVLT